MTNKEIGKQGEEIAKNFLIKKGFKILEMNYTYSKLAEIDIIAAKNKVVHFVEKITIHFCLCKILFIKHKRKVQKLSNRRCWDNFK